MNVDEQTAQSLLSLLGDCSQPLEHRAPVTIEGEPAGNPQAINVTNFLSNITEQINNHTDEYFSMLTVNNQLSTREGDTVNNQFSIYSPGTTYIQHLLGDDVTVGDLEVTGDLTVANYTWTDKEVVVDVAFSFDSDTCIGTLTVTKETIRILQSVELSTQTATGGPGNPSTPQSAPTNMPSKKPQQIQQTIYLNQLLQQRRRLPE